MPNAVSRGELWFYIVPLHLYVLHLHWRHEKPVDAIQILRVEKTDLKLPLAVGRLKYFYLRAESSS